MLLKQLLVGHFMCLPTDWITQLYFVWLPSSSVLQVADPGMRINSVPFLVCDLAGIMIGLCL